MTDAENSVDCLSVFQVSVARWLNVSEIVSLLTPGTTPLTISPAPPSSPPPSGTLLLYDRSKTRNYKADGYLWIKKRNSTKVREDHVKLRVGGQYRIAGCYVHSATTATFHRRAYHLLEPETSTPPAPDPDPSPPKKKQSLVLVHYLDTEQASAVSAKLSDHRIAATSSRQAGGSNGARRGGNGGDVPVSKAVARDLQEKTRVAVEETRKQHPLMMQQRGDRDRREAHSSYELADDHLDNIEAIKLSHAKHRLTASFDDDTLGMLWDMVMDEGGSTGGLESHGGDVDELKEAARTAIEQHLTPDMEEQLVSTVEQAVLEAAASTAVEQHMYPDVLEQKIEEVVDAEVVSTLDNHLPSDLEEQLVATMEQSLYGGGVSGSENSGGIGRGNIMDYNHDMMMLQQQQQQLMQAQQHQRQPPHHHHQQQQQQQQHQRHYQYQHHQHQHRPQDPITHMQASTRHAMAAPGSLSTVHHEGHHSSVSPQTANAFIGGSDTKIPAVTASGSLSVPPSPPHSDRTVTPTPLPDVIDFTPAEAHINRDKKLKIVVSTAASIPKLPPDDPLYVWHRLAAFVDIVAPAATVAPVFATAEGGGPSPTASSTERAAGDAVFRNVALSPLRQLTPFSYKCDLPSKILHPGLRSVILLGVRLAAGTDPVCDAVSAAVTLSLQAEWNAALDKTPRKGTIGSVMDRPIFYAAAGGVNVQLLSQLSQDFFDFIGEQPMAVGVGDGMETDTPEKLSTGSKSGAATPKSKVAQVASVAGGDAAVSATTGAASSKKSSEPTSLPAPAPAMATIASALIKFPDPPKRAVVPKPKQSQRQTSAGDVSDLSEDEYGAPVGAACDHPNRKRRASTGEDEDDAHHMAEEDVSVTSLGQAAKEWVSKTPQPNSDTTLGDSINRHCKIRFVERLANVVVGTESGGGSGNLQQTLPTSVDDGPVFLSDEQLQGINDEELDSLLDSVLIRFVESLVEQSEDDDELKEELNAPGFSGFTLLHYASLYNLKSLVPLLLSRGANPDITSLRGNLTPLHLACGAGHFQIVELLARNGCAVDARDSFGQTPANHADRNGFRDISAWLRARGGVVGDDALVVPVSAEAAAALEGSSPGDATDYLDDNKVLMRTAFSKLSLKDKLSLNFFVRKYKRDLHEGVRANTIMEDEEFESDDEGKKTRGGGVARTSGASLPSDLDEDLPGDELQGAAHRQSGHLEGDDGKIDECSFISEEDQENLDVAMSMMSKEELEDMESNATYSDVRKWMLRSNYESLREASMQLQFQAKGSGNAGNKRGEVGSQQLPRGEAKSSGSNEKTISQKNVGRDLRMGPKRSLNHAKLSQALAMLVLRKNLLAGKRTHGVTGLTASEEAQK